MTDFGGGTDLNRILSNSTHELLACQESVMNPSAGAEAPKEQEQKAITHLIETLQNAYSTLNHEMDAGRVGKINPDVMMNLEAAIEQAINTPLLIDAKVSQIYLSLFGWNTPLWHELRKMQQLLKTVEVLKQSRGLKVAKVDDIEKGKGKKRGQK